MMFSDVKAGERFFFVGIASTGTVCVKVDARRYALLEGDRAYRTVGVDLVVCRAAEAAQ